MNVSADVATDRRDLVRLDLTAIETALRELQSAFDCFKHKLSVPRDPFADEVIENMVVGYRCVDGFLHNDIGLLQIGNSKKLLELNKMVLCGEANGGDDTAAKFAKSNARRFYDESGAGIGAFMEFMERQAGQAPAVLAAGAYLQIVSQPQLFIEGNHRTGVLVASYILIRHKLPPFVMTLENAVHFLNLSALAKECNKNKFDRVFKFPVLKRQLAKLFGECADSRFIVSAG